MKGCNYMKIILDVGDKVKAKESINSSVYVDEIRKLASQYVTIRDRCGNWGYYIQETKDLDCDDVWSINDFELE